jgi:hypothetical protein
MSDGCGQKFRSETFAASFKDQIFMPDNKKAGKQYCTRDKFLRLWAYPCFPNIVIRRA